MTEADAIKIYKSNYNDYGVRDVEYWTEYAKKTNTNLNHFKHQGSTADGLFKDFTGGGYYKNTRFAFSTSNHSVVLKSITQHTITKINGSQFYKYFYNVMDPATGGTNVYNPNSIINVFRLFK